VFVTGKNVLSLKTSFNATSGVAIQQDGLDTYVVNMKMVLMSILLRLPCWVNMSIKVLLVRAWLQSGWMMFSEEQQSHVKFVNLASSANQLQDRPHTWNFLAHS
jgi:hypothetical protein